MDRTFPRQELGGSSSAFPITDRGGGRIPEALRRVSAVAIIVIMWGMTGCSTPVVLQQHTLAINKNGNPQRVDAHGHHKMDEVLFDNHLDAMIASMRSYAVNNPRAGTNPEVVIFIHGGMNTERQAAARVAALVPHMTNDGVYPIFVNWNSSLWSSYGDHLLWVRRGNAGYAGLAPVMTPFYLAADLGGAILKSPIVFLEGFWRTAEAIPCPVFQNEAQDGAILASQQLTELYGYAATRSNAIAIKVDGVGSPRPVQWCQTALTLLNTPTRALFAPFFHSLGTPAWNIMLRRVDLMFEREEASHKGYGFPVPPSGVLPRFGRRLAEFLKEEKEKTGRQWKVTLVGHSMGCIVTTELLERAMIHGASFPTVDNIVLMAPAGSQRDFEHAVIPYMKTNANTICSVLTLDMRGELWERHWRGVLPQGSLLVWIDDYFATPNSEADHTLGRFTNLMLASHRIPDDVRGRINFRAFPFPSRAIEHGPAKHGDFSSQRFWRRDFWDVRNSRN